MNKIVLIFWMSIFFLSCGNISTREVEITAETLLGNPKYQAICYGGYRSNSREIQPTLAELREDMMILAAMNIKVIRTYNVHFEEVSNLLQVISELKKEHENFEMYVMLGVWIDCKNAWTDKTLIRNENSPRNYVEIESAIELTNQYPDIIKIISVGNEAMVHWATSYYVEPIIILDWVLYLQGLKKEKKLPKDVWITSSDNFASWGGGESNYHNTDLKKLIQAVDYISMHTYPMHDTHYNPVFWNIEAQEEILSDKEIIDVAMYRALDYAISQYKSVSEYTKTLGIDKPIHIGETGWASVCNQIYGPKGSKAVDEYKAAKFYHLIRNWTNENNISCFYFEAFDEKWKDSANPMGSENHFGLFTVDGQAKFALWQEVDKNLFDGLTRNGNKISKTFDGDEFKLWEQVEIPSTISKKDNIISN